MAFTRRSTVVAKRIAARALSGFTLTPLDVLMAATNGEEFVNHGKARKPLTPMMLQAAAIAAPYVHPKLVAVKQEISHGPEGQPLAVLTTGSVDPVEAARVYAALMTAATTLTAAAAGRGPALLEHEAGVDDVEDLNLPRTRAPVRDKLENRPGVRELGPTHPDRPSSRKKPLVDQVLPVREAGGVQQPKLKRKR